MGLPKLDLPRYKHTLVGLGKKVSYRPFTTKEQKILLLAKESKEVDEVLEAMVQVVELCVYDDIDIRKLPSFDLEDLYLRIRSKSVSDETVLTYKIKETGEVLSKTINLDDVRVQTNKEHETKIMLTDNVGVQMSYPTILDFALSDDDLLIRCIEYVFDSDEVYTFSDFSKEEQDEWLESFDLKTFSKIQDFFKTMPVLKYETVLTSKEGKEYPITVTGLEDFFI